MAGNIGPSLIGRAKHMLHSWGVGQKQPLADERPFREIQRGREDNTPTTSKTTPSASRQQAQPEPVEVSRPARRRRLRLPFRR